MYHLTNYERETIINFNEAEDTASVYTHNKALRRKLEKLAQERPGECRLIKASHGDQAVEYYTPKAWIRINPTRQLSEVQRQALEKARLVLKSPVGADVQEREEPQTGKDTFQPLDGKKEA